MASGRASRSVPTALVAAVRRPVTAILFGNSAQVISPTMMPLSSPSAESYSTITG